MIVTAYCIMDFTNFPYDDQSCKMTFGSWAYDIRYIDMTYLSQYSNSSDYVENGQWDLLDIQTQRNAKVWEGFPNPYVTVDINIYIRRKAKSFTVTIVIPSAILSGLVLLTFILPPESGERVSLCITVLLAVTVFQQLTAQLMPRYQVPHLAEYYFVIILVTSISLVVTTLILNLFHRSTRRMPGWFRKLILVYLSSALFCRPQTDAKEKISLKKLSVMSPLVKQDEKLEKQKIEYEILFDPEAEEETRKLEWLRAVRVLDRLFVVIFGLTFLMALLAVFLRAPRFNTG